MLKIRLQRKGKKNQPFFRIIVIEKNNPPRGGRAVEILGFFNSLTKEKQINADRAKYWINVGAQPSDRVHNLLVQEGIIKAEKRPVHAKSKKKQEEQPAKQAKPAEAVPPPAEKLEEKPVEKSREEIKPEKKKPASPAGVEEKLEPEEKPEQEVKPEEPKKDESKKEEKPTEQDKKE